MNGVNPYTCDSNNLYAWQQQQQQQNGNIQRLTMAAAFNNGVTANGFSHLHPSVQFNASVAAHQPNPCSSSWQMALPAHQQQPHQNSLQNPMIPQINGHLGKHKKKKNGAIMNGVGHDRSTKLKLVMVGIGGVGKSSLTIQFVQQYFVMDYDPTISDSYTKSCFVDDALYRVEVVDTAGQEEYAAMREQHLRSADGFLLIFSVTSRQSLDYVLKLRKTIERLKDREHFPMLLVGNKCDLDSERQISRNEAENLAACLQIPYLESSAKFRQNVDQLFHMLIRQIRQFRYLERRCNGHFAAGEDGTDSGRENATGKDKRIGKKKKKEEEKEQKTIEKMMIKNGGGNTKKDKTCRIQ